MECREVSLDLLDIRFPEKENKNVDTPHQSSDEYDESIEKLFGVVDSSSEVILDKDHQ